MFIFFFQSLRDRPQQKDATLRGYLSFLIKATSVGGAEVLNETTIQCFTDKLVAMYEDDNSIKNIAHALSTSTKPPNVFVKL